jgi:hypothetical protein
MRTSRAAALFATMATKILIFLTRDESACREPLTPWEAEELHQRLLPMYQKVAKAAQDEGRKADAVKGGKTAGCGRKKIASAETLGKGKRDHSKESSARAAAPTGRSASTLRKTEKVALAAEANPGQFDGLVEELGTKDCKVDRVFKKFKSTVKSDRDK